MSRLTRYFQNGFPHHPNRRAKRSVPRKTSGHLLAELPCLATQVLDKPIGRRPMCATGTRTVESYHGSVNVLDQDARYIRRQANDLQRLPELDRINCQYDKSSLVDRCDLPMCSTGTAEYTTADVLNECLSRPSYLRPMCSTTSPAYWAIRRVTSDY
jgi:hypothetical protein